jgi:hypothetical protein
VGIAPETAFEMWSDFARLPEFLPSVLDAKQVGDGVYTLVLRSGDRTETTRVAYSIVEKPRRLVWRSRGGAKWNGEVVFRPTADGAEIRLIIDFEPSALREHPTERGFAVPAWNVGADLLAFQLYAENAGSRREADLAAIA